MQESCIDTYLIVSLSPQKFCQAENYSVLYFHHNKCSKTSVSAVLFSNKKISAQNSEETATEFLYIIKNLKTQEI